MKKALLSTLIVCTLICYFKAKGQDVIPENPQNSPNGIFDEIFDKDGRLYRLSDITIKEPLSPPGQSSPSTLSICNSTGYFNLYYEAGWEGNASASEQEDFKNVLCQVFNDISSFIPMPVGSTAKVNIWIRNINNVPGISNPCSGGVLGLASSFYSVPILNSVKGGIVDGEIWRTINSGKDSYTGVTSPLYIIGGQQQSPSGNFYHGMIALNFCQPSQWHANLSVVPPANQNQYDLYSTVLHELTHALGFISLINSNGKSKVLSKGNYYSRFDSFIETQSGIKAITNNGGCSLFDYDFNTLLSSTDLAPNPTNCISDYTDCSEALVFKSPSIAQKVYTPNCFSAGSSFSHFEDACPNAADNNKYFVMSNAGTTGPDGMKRYLKSEEVKALCSIGYKTNSTYGVSDNSNLNYINYSFNCPGNQIAGVNDGIENGVFVYTWTSDEQKELTGFLNNDYDATSFVKCVEDLFGKGTISYTSSTNSFIYKANYNAQGLTVLRYVPVNASGQEGNITYIFLYIKNGNCTPEACNMLYNGGFENGGTCGDFGRTNSTPDCWNYFYASVDYCTRDCSSPGFRRIPFTYNSHTYDTWNNGSGIINDKYMGMASVYADNYHEAAQSELSQPIYKDIEYTIRLRARSLSGEFFGNSISYIDIAASETNLAGGHYIQGNMPGVNKLLTGIKIPNETEWHLVEKTFTYTGGINPLNNLIIASAGFHNPGEPRQYVLIDDISLTPKNSDIFFTPPSKLCLGEVINDLSSYVSPTMPNGTFTATAGLENINGQYNFNSSLAGVGSHEVTFTYQNAIGCVISRAATIKVFSGSVVANAQATNANICRGSSTTLTTPTGAISYLWSPSASLDESDAASPVATPTVNTTYTVTVTDCGGNTSSSSIAITVVPDFDVNITIDPTNNPVCPLSSVTVHANVSPSSTTTYDFSWHIEGGNISSAIGQNVNLSASNNDIYLKVNVTAGVCVKTATYLLRVYPAPNATVTASPSVACLGFPVTLTAEPAPFTTPSYIWPSGFTATSPTTATGFPTASGTYNYIVTVTDAHSCTNTSAVTFSVLEKPPITLTSSTLSACYEDVVTITATSTPSATFSWGPGVTPSTGPFVTLSTPVQVGNVDYTVTVTDVNGCTNSSFVSINRYPYIPIDLISGNTLEYCGENSIVTLTATTPTNVVNFEWSDPFGNTYTGNPLTATVTSTLSGSITYNLTVTDANGCKNTAAQSINYKYICPCTGYCAHELIGTVSTGTYNQNSYCINGDITISGNVLFSGSEFKVAEGATITVLPSATFTVMGSHFYSCGDFLWNGIVAADNSVINMGESPAIQISFPPLINIIIPARSSFIEDAINAVKVDDRRANLSITGTIFNKNYTAIRLAKMQRFNQTSSNFSLNVTVENTVFTSRALPFSAATPGSPAGQSWPLVSSLKQTTGGNLQLASPYRMNNYAPAELKFIANDNLRTPFAGIFVSDIEDTPSGSPIVADLIVGRQVAGSVNIFDNLSFGILKLRASLRSFNNVFQNTIPIKDPSLANVLLPAGIAVADGNLLKNRLEVTATSATQNQNRFYDCHAAIFSWAGTKGLISYNISNCSIRSTQVNTMYETDHRGAFGIRLYAPELTNINITNNTFYNVESPIHLLNNLDKSCSIAITGNTMMLRPPNAPVPSGNTESPFIKKAITVEGGSLPGTGTNFSVAITQNTITGAHNGISCLNFSETALTVSDNTIELITNTITPNADQFGIESNNNIILNGLVRNTIRNNSISNTSGNVNGISSNTNMRGIYVDKGYYKDVMCNSTNRTYRGYEFADDQFTETRFTNNSMRNHKFGYVLSNNGMIGQQGSAATVCDNSWLGTNANWNGTSGGISGNFKTAIFGSVALNSPIFVRTGNNTNPDNSSFEVPYFPADVYSVVNGSIQVINNAGYPIVDPCAASDPGGITTPIGGLTPAILSLLEQIAQNQLLYPSYPEPSSIIGQNRLYELLNSRPVYRNASAVLENFYTQSQNTFRQLLQNIISLLQQQNLIGAQALVNSIVPQNDIEGNYQSFYTLYIKYASNLERLNASENSALQNMANSCPFTQGAVVYNARTLYNAVNKTNVVFASNCPSIVATRKGHFTETEQDAMVLNDLNGISFDADVYPNPNTDGLIMIAQVGHADALLEISVTDVAGKVVYKKDKQTENGNTSIQLDVNNGLYNVRITNLVTHETTIKKLVIAK